VVDIKDILRWLATGQTGESSKALAFCFAGIKGRSDHPLDPADFNRCLLLIHTYPEMRSLLPKAKALSPTWSKIIDHWDEIEQTFLDEAGLDWRKANAAPKTYKLMKDIGC
jgi:hypothetical protein